jgi:hypothetical protein
MLAINALRYNYHSNSGKLDVLCSPGTGSGSLRLPPCGSAFKGKASYFVLILKRRVTGIGNFSPTFVKKKKF